MAGNEDWCDGEVRPGDRRGHHDPVPRAQGGKTQGVWLPEDFYLNLFLFKA